LLKRNHKKLMKGGGRLLGKLSCRQNWRSEVRMKELL